MNTFVKGIAIIAVSALALAIAYLVLRVADTWEKRNTDALVDGLGMGFFFLIAMLVVILAIILTLKMAIRNKEQREAGGYADDYYAPGPPASRGRQPQGAYQYDYNVPVGQPQAGRQLAGPAMGTPIPWQQMPQGYPQGFVPGYNAPQGQGQPPQGYGFPSPVPDGQLTAQGAQYDLNSNLGW